MAVYDEELGVQRYDNNYSSRLNGRHVVFGKVIEGMDIIKKMVACGSEVSGVHCVNGSP